MKIVIAALLFCQFSKAYASLEGDYKLLKGPSSCPEGHIILKSQKNQKSRNLVFGARNAWEITEQDKGTTTETVEGGCTYLMNYNLSVESFTADTVRSDCPDKTENSIIKESIKLKNKKLTYKRESLLGKNIKNEFSCEYEKNK